MRCDAQIIGRVVNDVNDEHERIADHPRSKTAGMDSTGFRPGNRLGPFLALLMSFAPACITPGGPEPPAAVWPSGAEFRLEIADDPESRRKGYMFREHVGPYEGMLFIFEGPDRHPAIWMKNCKVSLDIIWLDESRRVVEIAHEQQPCPAEGPCPNVFPMRAARYVLEVAGGVARREGLRRGDVVELHLEEPDAP